MRCIGVEQNVDVLALPTLVLLDMHAGRCIQSKNAKHLASLSYMCSTVYRAGTSFYFFYALCYRLHTYFGIYQSGTQHSLADNLV